MFYIGTTRFNNLNYTENMLYREKHKINVIYGANMQINKKYPPHALIFVVEMNNETNKIIGIGLIRNVLICDKYYHIYNHTDYNRYVYKGTYWINRQTIEEIDNDIVKIFDTILFKGKSHVKRQSGIAVITDTLLNNWKLELDFLKDKLKKLFYNNFRSSTNLNEMLE